MGEELNEVRTLTLPEAAAVTGICKTTLKKFIDSGELSAVNISKTKRDCWRLTVGDIKRFFDSRRNQHPQSRVAKSYF